MNLSRFALCLLVSLFVSQQLQAAGKPNLIVIMADDLGYGDVSCYGATRVRTPNIDRLAAEGQRFTSGYCSASTCTPTRYSFLTGTYAFRKKRTGILRSFEVVLFPGGSGGKQGRAIGPTGREAVRDFVKRVGGIVGVCAGAYLCSAHYDWSLHVINTVVFNKTVEIPGVGRKSMWYRGGPHQVQMELEDSAALILGRTGDVAVRYQNGPILSAGTATDLPEFTPLAWFRSEVVKFEPQKGTMINTPAIVCADFGEGRVLSISPHPEATPGLESIIVNGIRWTAQSNQIK